MGNIRCLAVILTAVCCLLPAVCSAELIDRVVAFVNDRAITLSEVNAVYQGAIRAKPDLSRDEILQTMINRVLLVNEAKKLKIEAASDEELINEYIDIKVKAFIRLKEDDLEGFYQQHRDDFGDATYETVRDRIEEYLIEKEINNILKRHLAELRSRAYVKILDR